MIFNEIKCHFNTSVGLVGGTNPLHPPLCPRLPIIQIASPFAVLQVRDDFIVQIVWWHCAATHL